MRTNSPNLIENSDQRVEPGMLIYRKSKLRGSEGKMGKIVTCAWNWCGSA